MSQTEQKYTETDQTPQQAPVNSQSSSPSSEAQQSTTRQVIESTCSLPIEPCSLPQKRSQSSSQQDIDSDISKKAKISQTQIKAQKIQLKPSLQELQLQQESITSRLKQLRHLYGSRLNVLEEPPVNQCFLDYFISEMEWMANDFSKEKRGDISKAKKTVRQISQIVEQRRQLHLQQEQLLIQNKKKLAKRTSKLIQQYWKKIAKLGNHFKNLKEEEQRRGFRNKRLDSLVQKQLQLSNKVAKKIKKDYGNLNLYLKRRGELWQMCTEEEVQELEASHSSTNIPQRSMEMPFLIRHDLREYQKVGLNWLITIHDKKMNGILADEMGLGKTIQTIALLAHLACQRRVWGPHLIVVPTSLILNWEMELKRWCPGLKVLTYYGTQKERKAKRVGWTRLNSFHVCITSYQLVVQDQFVFKRKRWYYLILDEAQHIKNFHSQRWQVLLGFRSVKRLMLTGTPLQNDVMELWSLLHFLMPKLFDSHEDFHAWFSSPFGNAIAQNTEFSYPIVNRLHSILRPFLLRRMKIDVESQLPSKTEHVVFCDLSRRQQFLYDEYLEKRFSKSDDSVGIMNVLMQLRKVCNHPDLFAPKTVQSPLFIKSINYRLYSEYLLDDDYLGPNLDYLNIKLQRVEAIHRIKITSLPNIEQKPIYKCHDLTKHYPFWRYKINPSLIQAVSLFHATKLNKQRSRQKTTFEYYYCNYVVSQELRPNLKSRIKQLDQILIRFQVIQPKVVTHSPKLDFSRNCFRSFTQQRTLKKLYNNFSPTIRHIYPMHSRRHLMFPDRMALEHDCGKLRKLAILFRDLHNGQHKCLIFTQMTRMIDILEKFLNLHGYTYVRLDGSTKVQMRQMAVDRFNLDPKIFCFLSSTRSGGLGLNLTAADTVIFYDTDWNPAMDKQAQDRCHRIGQTRCVNIYRLISSYTIEENILQKTLQKRHLDSLVMEDGQFNTEYLRHQKVHVRDFFEQISTDKLEEACQLVEDAEDVKAAKRAHREEMADIDEFDEGEKVIDQVDPLTKLCLDRYLDENPPEVVEEEENINICSESSNSESEAFQVCPVDNPRNVFKNHMEFLKSRYIVY